MIRSLFKSKILLLIFVYCFVFFANFGEVNAMESLPNLFYQGLQESKEGDFINALETWSEFIEESPENGIAFSNRGIVRLALGDPEGAIRDQTKAIALSPEDIDPYLNRGIAEEALGHWEDACSDYNIVLNKNPDDISALYNLGNVMGSIGNWIEAKKLFSKASSDKNSIAMARSSEVLAIYQLGDLELAERKIRALIRKYPLFADARAALSALLWRKGFFGEAESNWTAVAGLDIRYRDKDWLLDVRRWPPKPTSDLMAFLALEGR